MNPGRLLVYLVRTLVGIAVFAPFWFWKGGVLELEVLQFIQQYLDERSVLRKVFDPYANDFRTYQARELSYFLDFLDAQVFRRLMAMDLVVFIPMTAVVASILTVAVFFVAVRRYRAVSPLTAGLLLLVYLTNYVHVVTMGVFYRSTKPLLAPVLMATVFYLATRFDRPAASGWRPPLRGWLPALIVFLLFCLMSLLDRQGFFYAVVGFVLLAGHAVYDRRQWNLVVAGGVAVASMVLYTVWIGPAIVSAVSGYVPSLTYQDVPRDQLVGGIRAYRQSAELLMEGVTVFLGSLPGVLAVLAVAAVAVAGVMRCQPRALAAAALIVVAASQVVMFALMVVRHPPLYEWIDHRYWYYPLPFQALLLALLVMVLSRVLPAWTGWRRTLLHVLLAAAVVSNVAHWTMYRDRMLTSRWFSRIYPQTAILKSSIQSGQPDPRLIKQYRDFYELCVTLSPGLRARAGR